MKRTFFYAMMAVMAFAFASCEGGNGSQKEAENEFQKLKDNQVFADGKVYDVKSEFHGNDHAWYIDMSGDEIGGGLDLGNDWIGKTIDITKPSVKANEQDGGTSMFMMQVMLGKDHNAEREPLFMIHTDWETGGLTGMTATGEEGLPFKSGKMTAEKKGDKCVFHLYGVLTDGTVFAVKLAGQMQGWD